MIPHFLLYLKYNIKKERFTLRYKILTLITFCISFLLSSCAVAINDIRPNQPAFAQVQSTVELLVYECKKTKDKKEECSLNSKGVKVAFGSGTFFTYKNNSAFLSAGHVCLGPVYGIWNSLPNNSRVKTEIVLKSYTGKEIRGKIKYVNLKYDLCIIETDKNTGLKNIPKISFIKPRLNSKFYSISAPFSIFHVGVVPVLEGRFFGDHKIFSFYSIPAGPGASGGPIYNSSNQIVGIVQRTHGYFPEISLSIKHKDLIDCLDYYLDMKKEQIEILIE